MCLLRHLSLIRQVKYDDSAKETNPALSAFTRRREIWVGRTASAPYFLLDLKLPCGALAMPMVVGNDTHAPAGAALHGTLCDIVQYPFAAVGTVVGVLSYGGHNYPT